MNNNNQDFIVDNKLVIMVNVISSYKPTANFYKDRNY